MFIYIIHDVFGQDNLKTKNKKNEKKDIYIDNIELDCSTDDR